MSIGSEEAGAMLMDVESVVARVKQSRIYRAASNILMFWGGLVVCGDLFAAAAPRWSGYAWFGLNLVGAGATIVAVRRSRLPGVDVPARLFAAYALFFLFGWMWTHAIGEFAPRGLEAFWPTYFLLFYAIAGLWFGFAFTAIGVALAAAVLAGFYWAGDGYPLYLALVNGGGMILCGYGMRRA